MQTPWRKSRIGRRVRGVGPMDARILLIGEAPGRTEEQIGEPFVGAAGQMQEELWGRLGIRRQDVRIENVCEVRPQGNRLEAIGKVGLERWQRDLWRRLEELRPTVIVPTGNYALNTIKGAAPIFKKAKGKLRLEWKYKITDWWGSIFKVEIGDSLVKAIPTLHPAALFRQPSWQRVWEMDWERIAEDQHFPELALSAAATAEHVVAPTIQQVERRLRGWRDSPPECLAVDIETPGRVIHCIGMAADPSSSITIPLTPQCWQHEPNPRRACARAWKTVADILADRTVAKVFHGGSFDVWVLRRLGGIATRGWRWDTQLMHLILDPTDRHSLAYCSSRLLRTRFWKHEAKEGEAGKTAYKKKDVIQWKRLHRYCGKDVTHTRELWQVLRDQLASMPGMMERYRQHYRQLSREANTLSLGGIRVLDQVRRKMLQERTAIMKTTRAAMTAAMGTDPVAKVGISNPRLAAYFYGTLKCKPIYDPKTRQITTNEIAIRRLMIRYPKARVTGGLVLVYRQNQKQVEFLAAKRVDKDGYFRALYKPTTETGRCVSATNPSGSGSNGQNIERSLRGMFTADPGEWLAEWDLSQAESRIVDGQSGDPELMRLAQVPPWELDQHRYNATLVFPKPMEEITSKERELGKRARHAINYDMEELMFIDVLLKETEGQIVLAPEEGNELLDRMKAARPGVRLWQEWVIDQGLREGIIQTSWGIPLRIWPTQRLSKHDHKEWLGYKAQSEVGRLLNQWGWIPAARAIRQEGLRCRIVGQYHDALGASGRLEDLWRLDTVVRGVLGQSREYDGRAGSWTLAMPIGLKLGRTWGKGMVEWKKPPTRRQFMEAGRAMPEVGEG